MQKVMLAPHRRNAIRKIITEKLSVSVTDLAQQFGVTTETIRNDLEKLEKLGVLTRTYGGAICAVDYSGTELTVSEREVINSEGKRKIGKYAASLINDGEVCFLDASTSSLNVARHIEKKVMIITNSLSIVNELAEKDNIKVVMLGGMLERTSMSFCGAVTLQSIENYYADKCFFSGRGVTLAQGIMESNEAAAMVKCAMIKYCRSSIFLCDKSKMGKLGYPVIMPLDKVDYIISDAALSEDWLDKLRETEVITV